MKFNIILLGILFVTTLFAQNRRFDRYLEELAEEFQIKQVQPDSLQFLKPLLLDTREKEEYQISHIQDAIYAGYYDFDLQQFENINKDTIIVVYCSVGYRSSKIAEKLIKDGFKDVRNLYGGIFKWINLNKEIVVNKVPTDTIHTYNKRWGRYITNDSVVKIP